MFYYKHEITLDVVEVEGTLFFISYIIYFANTVENCIIQNLK